jgi:hydroxyacylglutathione hydrolase
MLFERIVSKGLAQCSYLIGDKNEAIVIDPRRDCEVYIQKASAEGMKVNHILETHRNEDYFVGSMELAKRTGSEVWHADGHLDYRYGKTVIPGQRWKIGRLEIEAIATPGHTPGSMSYLLRDPGGLNWVVFTGDALFAGDVGVLTSWVREGHQKWQACFTRASFKSIGLERIDNPRLKARSKEEFMTALLGAHLERPPYFSMMEKVNLQGEPILGAMPIPRPLSSQDFVALAGDAQILDTRMELGFAAAHVPNAQSIWPGGLASFA